VPSLIIRDHRTRRPRPQFCDMLSKFLEEGHRLTQFTVRVVSRPPIHGGLLVATPRLCGPERRRHHQGDCPGRHVRGHPRRHCSGSEHWQALPWNHLERRQASTLKRPIRQHLQGDFRRLG
jgi:hypothetical protein